MSKKVLKISGSGTVFYSRIRTGVSDLDFLRAKTVHIYSLPGYQVFSALGYLLCTAVKFWNFCTSFERFFWEHCITTSLIRWRTHSVELSSTWHQKSSPDPATARWVFKAGSGSSFLPQCRSGSIDLNQRGSIRIRILFRLCSHKQLFFYMKDHKSYLRILFERLLFPIALNFYGIITI
jgi:hypothetical protein